MSKILSFSHVKPFAFCLQDINILFHGTWWHDWLTPKILWNQKLVNNCLGTLCEEFFLKINFFFWMSELYISQAFPEQFRSHMSPWWIFVENGYKAHFSCIFWGPPTCNHVAKTTQVLKGRVLIKYFFFSIKSCLSLFFTFFFFCSWSYMMSPSMWLLWSKHEVFDFFPRNFTRFTVCVEVWS